MKEYKDRLYSVRVRRNIQRKNMNFGVIKTESLNKYLIKYLFLSTVIGPSPYNG